MDAICYTFFFLALLFILPECSMHFQDNFHTFERSLTLFSEDSNVVPMKRDADTA